MKLREVVKAVSGFKYEVQEYDVFPNKAPVPKRHEVKINKTDMRCQVPGQWFEVMIKGLWKLIEQDQYFSILDSHTKKVVTRTKTGEVRKIDPKKQSVVDRLNVTPHFSLRMEERYGISEENLKTWLNKFLEDHKVLQGAELYNTVRQDVEMKNLYVHSVGLSATIVLKWNKNGRYDLLTVYDAEESKWFHNWKVENGRFWDEMPTIYDWFEV